MSSISSIALSGLNDAALRASNAANNIANACSTAALPAAGGGYAGFQPQDVVSLSVAGGGMASALQPRNPAWLAAPGGGAANANAQGLVAAPNVDLATEVVALGTAQLSYAADAKLIKADDRMQKSLLDVLG